MDAMVPSSATRRPGGCAACAELVLSGQSRKNTFGAILAQAMDGQGSNTPERRERTTAASTHAITPSRRRVAVAVGLAAIAGGALPVRADPAVSVLLLRPVPTSPALSEAMVRIRSELSAGGFEVVERDTPAADLLPEPHALMERSAQVPAPSATLAIFGDLGRGVAELWVVDRITGKAVVRRMEVQAEADRPISEVLAIRAQELLRASLVEVVVEEDAPPPAPPPRVEQTRRPQDSLPGTWRMGLELGLATLGGWGGIGPALAPAARPRVAIDHRFWARLTALGFGTQPEVRSTVGSARIRQDLILLEGMAWLRPGRRLRPMISVGLGSERFAVDGTASMQPYLGEHNARWSFVADAGLGAALRLAIHWEVQLEAHALVAAPRPEVRFFDAGGARAGQPTLLAILTLAGGA